VEGDPRVGIGAANGSMAIGTATHMNALPPRRHGRRAGERPGFPWAAAAGLAAFGTALGVLLLVLVARRTPAGTPRELLFEELQPSRLDTCALKRYGEAHDGGYLMCGNLLSAVGVGYSYGINGYDGWGCDISRELGIVVHQYDCFNTTVPACPGGATTFHAECVGGRPRFDEAGRRFDSVLNQLARNGDAGKRVVLKIDVEGAEWETFLSAPDAVLERIDQLAVEFHGVDDTRALPVVRRLKEHFHVAYLHFNNYSCAPDLDPFPASVYEVLFVSKRLARIDRAKTALAALTFSGRPSSPLATPSGPNRPDCQ